MRAIVATVQGQAAELAELPQPVITNDGDVLIRVSHSSVNFKDGATVTARPGFVHAWPIALGIDVIGTVEESHSPDFTRGDRVTLNGAGAGERFSGGYAEFAVAPAASLIHIPDGVSNERAAAIGTAGFTAALAVLVLEDHGLQPGDGEVLVTGAAGGVGSVAVNLLAKRGYTVVASSGRMATEGDHLARLGSARIIDRTELSEPGPPGLQDERWAGVIDGIGSHTLANALAQTRYQGIAVAYGLAQGVDLPTTVLPFIKRAVTLAGANSVEAPKGLRERAWAMLAAELDLDALDAMTERIALADVPGIAPRVLSGLVRGRTVVDIAR